MDKNVQKLLYLKYVDSEDKGMIKTIIPGGNQPITVITESCLYSLILSNKLPFAKEFKRWGTSEVLPKIRKDGMRNKIVFGKQGIAVPTLLQAMHMMPHILRPP